MVNVGSTDVVLYPRTVVGTLNIVNVVSLPSEVTEVPLDVATVSSQVVLPSVQQQVEDIDLSSLPPQEQGQVRSLLRQYTPVFSTHEGDLGCISLIFHDIPLVDDVPVRQCYRRIPPSEYEVAKEHINQLLSSQVIRESSSPYASPIVLCPPGPQDVEAMLPGTALPKPLQQVLGRAEATQGVIVAMPQHTSAELRALQQADPVVQKLWEFWVNKQRPSHEEWTQLPQAVLALLRQWDRLIERDGVCLPMWPSGVGHGRGVSKYTIAVPTRDQRASTVAMVLVSEWFYKFGVPARLHSDQGRNFESSLIQQLCNLYGIAKSRTTPYHPAGNECDGMMDKGVLKPVGPALGKEQSFTEQAPLVADDGVQRVAGIVHNIQQFVQSPRLCHRHQRVQLHVPTTEPARLISLSSLDVSFLDMLPPPAYYSVKEDTTQTTDWWLVCVVQSSLLSSHSPRYL
ncbi:hypothetical protein L3Q82_001630 [Scortum barcoo]|uniref:Uncharacterized protein n=1 Tax=Scortum barcoo TaxID=214431 RepID=A0ACB8W4I2_9TELE|nr:hypothetical protein L3Q82_001630 [Scortum barcoo]